MSAVATAVRQASRRPWLPRGAATWHADAPRDRLGVLIDGRARWAPTPCPGNGSMYPRSGATNTDTVGIHTPVHPKTAHVSGISGGAYHTLGRLTIAYHCGHYDAEMWL